MYEEYEVCIQYMDNREETIICNEIQVRNNSNLLYLITYDNSDLDYKYFRVQKSIGVVLSNVRYYKSERVRKGV